MSTVMFPNIMHWPSNCHNLVSMTRYKDQLGTRGGGGLLGHVITCLQTDDLDDLFINQTLIKSTKYRREQLRINVLIIFKSRYDLDI